MSFTCILETLTSCLQSQYETVIVKKLFNFSLLYIMTCSFNIHNSYQIYTEIANDITSLLHATETTKICKFSTSVVLTFASTLLH